jgi:hypothetical protein
MQGRLGYLPLGRITPPFRARRRNNRHTDPSAEGRQRSSRRHACLWLRCERPSPASPTLLSPSFPQTAGRGRLADPRGRHADRSQDLTRGCSCRLYVLTTHPQTHTPPIVRNAKEKGGREAHTSSKEHTPPHLLPSAPKPTMYVLRLQTTTTPESRSQRTRYLHQSVSRLHPNQIPKRVLHSLSPPSSASPYLARHFTARCRP